MEVLLWCRAYLLGSHVLPELSNDPSACPQCSPPAQPVPPHRLCCTLRPTPSSRLNSSMLLLGCLPLLDLQHFVVGQPREPGPLLSSRKPRPLAQPRQSSGLCEGMGVCRPASLKGGRADIQFTVQKTIFWSLTHTVNRHLGPSLAGC